MAKTIKVYGTTAILAGELLDTAHQLGLPEYARQVRLICGATSFAEANRLCAAEGMYDRMFQRDCSSVSYNDKEVELAGNGGIFIGINNDYYSIEQLKEIMDNV